jgi:DNA-binding FadR family transcriptional regulator
MDGTGRKRQTRTPGRNLTRDMLDAVGRDIVVGAYDGAAFPTEAELTRRYGVSRSVTREAMKMLAAKGLLTARPRQGTSVTPQETWNLSDPDVLRWMLERTFNLQLLVHFSQLRAAVEPAAAALAAKAADPSHLAAIRAGFARMEAADRGEDDALDSDIAFHVAILNASGNPFFVQFRDLVSAALRSSIRFTNRIAGHSASLPAHAAVMHAIEARDAAGARAAMAAIIDDVLDLIQGARGAQARELAAADAA